MLQMKNTFNFSKIFLYVLLFLLPIFIILFLAGGCSFKYFNPQYYKFLELCKDVDKKVVVYNEDYWEIFSDNNIKTDDKGCFYSNKLKQEICFGYFAYSKHNKSYTKYNKLGLSESLNERYYNDIHYVTFISYGYNYYGLFLKGDEAAGWHWETKVSLTCSYLGNAMNYGE